MFKRYKLHVGPDATDKNYIGVHMGYIELPSNWGPEAVHKFFETCQSVVAIPDETFNVQEVGIDYVSETKRK